MRDARGKSIAVGDTVAYATRSGTLMFLREGIVTQLLDNLDVIVLRPQGIPGQAKIACRNRREIMKVAA